MCYHCFCQDRSLQTDNLAQEMSHGCHGGWCDWLCHTLNKPVKFNNRKSERLFHPLPPCPERTVLLQIITFLSPSSTNRHSETISWLGVISEAGGSRSGSRREWLWWVFLHGRPRLLVLSCPPGNLGPAAAHYTRNVSWVRCQESGGTLITEWPLAQSLLWVIDMAHSNPSHVLRPPLP